MTGTLSWFARRESGVSSHWVIGRDGEKVRVIPDEMQAWHAGKHNGVAFGIELCQGVESDGFTDEQMNSLVLICRDYMAEYGIPAVFDPDMTAKGFLGHEDSPQGRSVGKSDPGMGFNWADFLDRLRDEEDDSMTPQLIRKKGSHESYRAEGKVFVLNKSAQEREDYADLWDLEPNTLREVPGEVIDRGKARGWVKE